jgi:hypothetical protein
VIPGRVYGADRWTPGQTKELANRYERALQESEMSTEKSKNRLEVTSEELERVLLQKEGESFKESGIQGRSPGGKRAIGKAVAKGGLLLKGKNPGNVRFPLVHIFYILAQYLKCYRSRGKKMMSEQECPRLQMHIERLWLIHRQYGKNISTFNYPGYYV